MRLLTTRDLIQWADATLIAVAFLSRIPVAGSVFARNPGALLAECAWAFPLAGLVIALPACLVMLAAAAALPASMAAALVLAALAMIAGALHEDGLADCADAFFAPVNRERRLDIMKDSRIGTFGALALIIHFALAWSALTAIIELSAMAAAASIIAAAGLSRTGIVWHWHVLPFARAGGLAERQGRPDWNAVLASAGIACVIALCVIPTAFGWLALLAALASAALASLAGMIVARAKIGGQTGDTLGMTQKLVEVFVLTALAGWAG
ncbi:MAG: adenosylcobinamide-GDP ribazoletransferase [Rhizobiaceae bacterium]|jgi:adenosylcobinamide-GDP ribazoletransferase|nr:adenosylcobinamide-GDP ribazoletransferase [Rhizobiaceae bacterium]